ncbi:hypothetical protein CUMW_174470 [Citrus unshiu]|uniref:Uncharacterized protein n=1 Tax=Citrus unshiu TaxID=55188 RepID=A0A2H5PWQ4_CITUN|nr:hypothetical protein CUMW_174470 [Citrus unshiu]
MIRHGTRLAGTEQHYGFRSDKLLSLRTPRAIDPAGKARECIGHVDRGLTVTRRRRDLRDRANPKRSGADLESVGGRRAPGFRYLRNGRSGDRFTVERTDPPLHFRERERDYDLDWSLRVSERYRGF